MFPLRAIFASLLGLLLASAAQAGAVLSIDYAETTHVTTSGFSAVFESSLPASPSIAVYSDANGASEITDQFEVSIYPFQGGDPAAADEIAQADAADALAAAAQARGLAKIRVHGGAPGTTYYYRVTAFIAMRTARARSRINSRSASTHFRAGTPRRPMKSPRPTPPMRWPPRRRPAAWRRSAFTGAPPGPPTTTGSRRAKTEAPSPFPRAARRLRSPPWPRTPSSRSRPRSW